MRLKILPAAVPLPLRTYNTGPFTWKQELHVFVVEVAPVDRTH